VFKVALALCCLAIVPAVAMEWKSVKQKKPIEESQAAADE